MSDTPRTDAAAEDCDLCDCITEHSVQAVRVEFARQLEREIADARMRAIEWVLNYLDDSGDFYDDYQGLSARNVLRRLLDKKSHE